MVTRRHHHERGHERVGDHEHAQGPVADHGVQRERTPDRPGHVQARHRRVLVARGVDQAGLQVPGSPGPQRVHDPEAGRQQPGRRHRVEPEADERHRRRYRQGRARASVLFGMAQQQPGQGDGRDQEVRAPVVRVERVRDGIPRSEHRLHGLFMEQADGPFGRDDRQRVAGRRPARLHHVPADLLVDQEKNRNERQLPGHPPPAGPAGHAVPAAPRGHAVPAAPCYEPVPAGSQRGRSPLARIAGISCRPYHGRSPSARITGVPHPDHMHVPSPRFDTPRMDVA